MTKRDLWVVLALVSWAVLLSGWIPDPPSLVASDAVAPERPPSKPLGAHWVQRAVRRVQHPPRGLPPVPVPADNPLTPAKVVLGQKLFNDRRLSLNETIACVTCHVPEHGYTVNSMQTAVGIEGHTLGRNASTLFNAAYETRLFWDGREHTLETQIWSPLLNPFEMGAPGVGWVVQKLDRLPEYQGLFRKSFHGRGPSMGTISEALASYMRTLISGNSPFDQWLYGRQEGAMTAQALRGYKLFVGKAGCVQCHTIGPRASLFTDNQFHNTGVGWQQSMGASTGYRQVPVAPGLTVELSDKVIDSVTGVRHHDDGRYTITLDPADRWKYKTPSVRNVALTAPYMHNGSLPTLDEVVKLYNQGGIPNPGLDPLIHPLSLSQSEEDDLVAFLKSLTGSNVRELISETREQPVSKFAPSESYN